MPLQQLRMKQKANDNINKSFTFKGLGTEFIILTSHELSDKKKNNIIESVNDFETNYSRFRENSKLSKLNKTKKLSKPSSEMQEMLLFAIDTWKATNGLFNISIGGVLEEQGYGHINRKVSTVSKDLTEDIMVSPDLIEINYDIWLDFGGFGKGWFIDKLSRQLKSWGINDYLINGGGDIKIGESPLNIQLENPLNDSEYLGIIRLKNNAFGASSNLKRTWNSEKNKKYSHIQRPDGTNLDERILLSATMSDTALKADILATCLLLDPSTANLEEIKKWGEYCFVFNNLKVLRTKNFHIQHN